MARQVNNASKLRPDENLRKLFNLLSETDKALQSDPAISKEFKEKSTGLYNQWADLVNDEHMRLARRRLSETPPPVSVTSLTLPPDFLTAEIKNGLVSSAESEDDTPGDEDEPGASKASIFKRNKKRKEREDGFYQCTWDWKKCPRTFKNSGDWKRHEQTLSHWPQGNYMCLFCPIFTQTPEDWFKCNFCPNVFENQDLVEAHVLQCPNAKDGGKNGGRVFTRKDKFTLHLKIHEEMNNPLEALRTKDWTCTRSGGKEWPRYCGFCGQVSVTWLARFRHMKEHFKAGLRMETDWGKFPSSSVQPFGSQPNFFQSTNYAQVSFQPDYPLTANQKASIQSAAHQFSDSQQSNYQFGASQPQNIQPQLAGYGSPVYQSSGYLPAPSGGFGDLNGPAFDEDDDSEDIMPGHKRTCVSRDLSDFEVKPEEKESILGKLSNAMRHRAHTEGSVPQSAMVRPKPKKKMSSAFESLTTLFEHVEIKDQAEGKPPSAVLNDFSKKIKQVPLTEKIYYFSKDQVSHFIDHLPCGACSQYVLKKLASWSVKDHSTSDAHSVPAHAEKERTHSTGEIEKHSDGHEVKQHHGILGLLGHGKRTADHESAVESPEMTSTSRMPSPGLAPPGMKPLQRSKTEPAIIRHQPKEHDSGTLDLLCCFRFLGCDKHYPAHEYKDWMAHNQSHLAVDNDGKTQYPQHISCTFCKAHFHSSFSDNLELAWKAKLIHLATHIVDGVDRKHAKVDYCLVKYAMKSHVVDWTEWTLLYKYLEKPFPVLHWSERCRISSEQFAHTILELARDQKELEDERDGKHDDGEKDKKNEEPEIKREKKEDTEFTKSPPLPPRPSVEKSNYFEVINAEKDEKDQQTKSAIQKAENKSIKPPSLPPRRSPEKSDYFGVMQEAPASFLPPPLPTRATA